MFEGSGIVKTDKTKEHHHPLLCIKTVTVSPSLHLELVHVNHTK